jgi:type IV pilus assembly protein PilO
MIARPTSQRDQAMLLVSLVAFAGVFAYWYFLYQPKSAELATITARIETLEANNARAKAVLARGSMDALDQQRSELDENLRVMRSLIPTGNEVPALLDQILAAARRNNLELGDFAPSETVTGTTFDTYGFRLSLRGTYHEIGEVLASIASLRRIIVPVNVTLTPATTPGRREAQVGEQMLIATFDVLTYVVRTGVSP